jgi:hypothetical protein
MLLPFFLDVSILGELTELLRLKASLILVVSHPFAKNAKGWGTELCALLDAPRATTGTPTPSRILPLRGGMRPVDQDDNV